MLGKIADAQARLNLNNLVPDPNAAEITQAETTTPLQGAPNAPQGSMGAQDTQIELTTHIQLSRLLVELQLNPALADAIIDWVDADLNARGSYSGEDDYYSRLKHPYRTANQSMVSISELRLIKGFTEKAYQKILPFVTALPTHTDINVNTAQA